MLAVEHKATLLSSVKLYTPNHQVEHFRKQNGTWSNLRKLHNKTKETTGIPPGHQMTDTHSHSHREGPAEGSGHRHPRPLGRKPAGTGRSSRRYRSASSRPAEGALTPSSVERLTGGTHHRAPGLTSPKSVSAPGGPRGGAAEPGPAVLPPSSRTRPATGAGERSPRLTAAQRRGKETPGQCGPAAARRTGPDGTARAQTAREAPSRPHLGLKSWNKPRRFIAARPSAPAALYQARMVWPPPEPGLAWPRRRSAPAGTGQPPPPRACAPPARPRGGVPLPGSGLPLRPGFTSEHRACARRRLAHAP